MDKIYAERGSSKKGDQGMEEAVGSAEGVREWRFQMHETDDLVKELVTVVREKPDDTVFTGLTHAAALERLKRDGPNALTEKKALPGYVLFAKELTGFFSLLLWFGSALCFIGYALQSDKSDRSNLYLGIVLASVTLITGCFSYYQSSKSAAMMAQFKNFIPQ